VLQVMQVAVAESRGDGLWHNQLALSVLVQQVQVVIRVIATLSLAAVEMLLAFWVEQVEVAMLAQQIIGVFLQERQVAVVA